MADEGYRSLSVSAETYDRLETIRKDRGHRSIAATIEDLARAAA